MSDTDRIAALEAQLRLLQSELETLKADTASGPDQASRRDVFKKLAIGAAGAAVAGAGVLAAARPAAAANGDPLTLGQVNTATNATTLNNTGAASIGVALLVQSGTGYTASEAAYRSALAGWASADGNATDGVYGFSEKTNGIGVVGFGGVGVAGSVGGLFRGARAALNVVSSGSASSVGAVAHNVGDVIATDDGSLWYVGAAGTPGTLRKLSGPTTAGQLHLLAAPVRVYDSRSSAGTGFGPLNSTTPNRSVDLKNGTVGATPTAAVPAGATGALFSLTVTNTTGSGFAAAFSNAVSWPGNSSVNWTAAGQTVAVTTVSAVDASALVKIQVGGGAGYGADFLVDVIGYYQ